MHLAPVVGDQGFEVDPVAASTQLRSRIFGHVDETKVSSPHCLRRVVANEPGFRPNFDSVYFDHVDEARL